MQPDCPSKSEAIDGEAVADVLDLYRVLDGLQVGHDAQVTLQRDGEQRTVTVRLTPLTN